MAVFRKFIKVVFEHEETDQVLSYKFSNPPPPFAL